MAGGGSRDTAGPGLSATDIAWCGQAEITVRARWARDGRLKHDGPWTEHDAVETAIAFAIPSGVHATKVWDTIQKDVQKLILAGKAEQIWLVVAQVGGDHRAVAGGAAAARAAHDIGGSCRVCETRDAVREAKRRWAVKAGEQSAVVTPIRRRKTGQQGT